MEDDPDTITTASNLRQTPEAMLQGPQRFTRSHASMRRRDLRRRLSGFRSPGRLDTVPGAGRSNALMAPRAAEILAQ
ncbi:MAG: hypothetical protein OXE96_02905 [Gemmatimonadetes bacterium]|nr:hypothetical protein [Gemmatimonadota bacterium]